MASSTQWRINITDINGGWAIAVADIQFRTAVGSPLAFPDMDADAEYWVGGSFYDVLDEDEWTFWETNTETASWWRYTYPSPVEIVSYVLRAPADVDYLDNMPKNWTLQYYNGSTWVTVDTQTDSTDWTVAECREFRCGVPGYIPRGGLWKESSTKWRFHVTAVDGGTHLAISNFQLRRSTTGSSYFFDHWTHEPSISAVYATNEDGSDVAANAVTDDAGAIWATETGTTDATLTLEFVYPHKGVQYHFDCPSSGVAPASFTLEYWDVYAEEWVLADSQTGESGTSQTYTITPDTSPTDFPEPGGEVTWPEMTVTAPFEPLALLPFASDGGTILQGAAYTSYINLGDPNVFGGAFIATPFTLSASGFGSAAFLGAVEWPRLTVDASLEHALALPELTLSGTGFAGNAGDGVGTLPLWGVDAGLEDAHNLPFWQVDAQGDTGSVGEGDAVLALWEVAGALDPALAWPDITLDALAFNGALGSGNALWPALAADGALLPQVAIDWPQASVAATAVNGTLATGNATWPKATASGILAQDGSADGQATLQAVTASGVVVSDTLAGGGAVLGYWSVTASAVGGTVGTGSATLTLPLWAVSASGFMDAVGTADVVLPLLQVAATGSSTAVAAPVFSTLTLNTRTQAAATHTNLAFNSLAQFAGLTLAATPQGIVALLGESDQGAPIAAHVTSGLSDLGNEHMKRVLCGYVGYRAAGGMDLTLVTDQHHEYVYRLDPRQEAADLHPSRVKTGRGVDGRYWQWTLANTDGQAFELDRLTFDADKLSRRV